MLRDPGALGSTKHHRDVLCFTPRRFSMEAHGPYAVHWGLQPPTYDTITQSSAANPCGTGGDAHINPITRETARGVGIPVPKGNIIKSRGALMRDFAERDPAPKKYQFANLYTPQ
jgi:hypothetical protein